MAVVENTWFWCTIISIDPQLTIPSRQWVKEKILAELVYEVLETTH